MNETIVNAIVEMVKSGGTAALWIYLVYVLGTVAKVVIGFGFFYLAVRKISATLELICGEK